jgi:Ankyrin repeat
MAKRNAIAAASGCSTTAPTRTGAGAACGVEVTALHLAVAHGHGHMVRPLLDAGADPRIRDSEHDADAIGRAAFFRAAGPRRAARAQR